jgi:ABC-type tungstate transport system permease subunit
MLVARTFQIRRNLRIYNFIKIVGPDPDPAEFEGGRITPKHFIVNKVAFKTETTLINICLPVFCVIRCF